MSSSRRTFLRLSGLGLIGATATTAFDLCAAGDGQPAGDRTAPAGPRPALVVNLRALEANHSWDRVVDACHRAHNVPSFPAAKDEVKWIWTEEFHHVFPELDNPYRDLPPTQQRVPVLCNHCDNPPCTKVCPTQATWRRDDGVVMMDWHRCIGCRYCIVACPYGSRSFNWRDPRQGLAQPDPAYPTRQRGVVEKCTLCAERLDRGELPACVEACANGEIIFGDLSDPGSEVRRVLAANTTIRRKPSLGTQPQVYYIL